MSRKFQVIIFVMAATAFTYLVLHAGLRGLLANIGEAKIALGPIILVWGLVYMLNTYAWLRLLRIGSNGDASFATIPFWRAYAISVTSFSINYVTPFVNLGGEPFRVAAATPWVGRKRATASVASFRVTHTTGQLLFWLTSIPIAFALLPRKLGIVVGLCLVAAILTAVLIAIFLLARQHVAERLLNFLQKFPLTRRFAPQLEKERTLCAHVDAELAELMGEGRPHFLPALAAEYLGRALSMVEYLVIARAIGLPVNYLGAFVMGAFTQFVQNITFFIPMDLGIKEGGMYLIFQLLRLTPRVGVYTAVVTRLRELFWIGVGLGFIWLARRRGTVPTEV